MISVTKFFILSGVFFGLTVCSVLGQQTPVEQVKINKTPLCNFGAIVLEKHRAGKLDLSRPFRVELKGTLNKDGKLDLSGSRWVKSEGSEEMVVVAKEAAKAVNDSGWFAYVRNLRGERIVISASQDEKTFNAVLKVDAGTTERANAVASSLNMMLSISRMQSKSERDKVLLDALRVRVINSDYVIDFELPAAVFQEMVRMELGK